MPRRTDIARILVLGSGPIVIGQAGEFDYSGTQGCTALREEGYTVILANSNPATIMTDPGIADRTYVEPLDVAGVREVIARERPDALLPTLGGQTALNLAIELERSGVLAEAGVELIGARAEVIRRAEDRDEFRETMRAAGLETPASHVVTDLDGGRAAVAELGLPVILRPGFTLGGEGGGVATTADEFEAKLASGLAASPIGQVLIEESLLGWDEFELEVVRDANDNAVIVCSIENLDPMGVHTGDSVTVAPAMTLSDGELQQLRDQALAVVRAVGVETGGSNVQFALERESGRCRVIEMNPRVSRSSALASKATGFPIAKLAARLAVGYTLDELPNEITGVTPASFEPSLDYVAVKMPRFAFEKFPGADTALTTHMKSVGEVLALGRSFGEALGKAVGARELDVPLREPASLEDALELMATPSWDRVDLMLAAARAGAAPEELAAATGVHPWFCREIVALAAAEGAFPADLEAATQDDFRAARLAGVTDAALAAHTDADVLAVGRRRRAAGVRSSYHAVDTCAAEFAARTPYYYAANETDQEVVRDEREAIVILGSGPNRIGQGIEFDYSCVHGAQTVRDLGRAAVMVNCNPETVSTDHGVSDRLYLEPVTAESVIEICHAEKPRGVITQLGGQTPLRLAAALEAEGIPLLGTPSEAIDLAEDRERFGDLLAELGLAAPPWAVAEDPAQLAPAAERVGYPVLVRPSYVLGGRAMEICDDEGQLEDYVRRHRPTGRTFLDRFLDGALEIDVDALCDGESVWTAAVMEHVEAAGVHSGDSACVLPPQSLGPAAIAEIERQTAALGAALGVVGLLNVQFVVDRDEIFVIEVNPRASRTVPFVSKATGVSLVRHAVRIMLGARLTDLDLPSGPPAGQVAVKEAVLPFDRFVGADPALGPEMHATGEVMALGGSFPEAFAKAQRAAGQPLPDEGTIFLSVRDADKPGGVALGADLTAAGFTLLATEGTGAALRAAGIPAETVSKIMTGDTSILDRLAAGEVALVIDTPSGSDAHVDGGAIRRAAVRAGVPLYHHARRRPGRRPRHRRARPRPRPRAPGPPIRAPRTAHRHAVGAVGPGHPAPPPVPPRGMRASSSRSQGRPRRAA